MHKLGVSFIIPFRVYIPENFYEVRIGDKQNIIKPQVLPPIKIGQGLEAHGANIEFSHDIFGYAGRTLCYILLDQQIDISTEVGKKDFAEKDQIFIQDAVIVVNRFLEVYRDQDKDSLGHTSFHIIPIAISDISDIKVFPVKEDKSEEQSICIRIPRLSTMGFRTATKRSAEVISEIAKLLKNGTEIPVYRELLSSSMNAIWKGQYRIAPVEANTAFEAFVDEITLLLESPMLPDNLFDKIVLLESVLNHKLTSKSLAAISWFTPQKNGWKSLLDSTLINWKEKCYELRNKVIHKGHSQVTLNEAKDSYEASLQAIAYIRGITRIILE